MLDGLSNHNGKTMKKVLYGRLFSTKVLSLVILMTSINLVSNYALIGIPNVKFMDLVVFVSGYLMGVAPGVLVGVLTWLVYGTLNPRGFNLVILAATCLGESLYGVAGWLSAKFRLGLGFSSFGEAGGGSVWWANLKFGVVGFFSTFIYDLFTNIVSVTIVGLPPLMAIIQGAPFAIIHEVSNFFFFFFGCSALITAVKKVMYEGGEKL
ncbi:MAG: hypothetical protein QXU95_04485 [Candidatus Bathyarchaeia archaeon]|nr:hypothetical protein [Candidatus Bathyarchaeota archaeon]